MKVYELKNEFEGISNGDLIKFLKSKGFKVSSHNQNVTDEMIDLARENFAKKVEEVVEEVVDEAPADTLVTILTPME